MLLTIGIGIYNGEKTIRETLNSIISQIKKNKKDIEILIIDNNSKDNSYKIVKKYSKKYKFIRVFKNKENIGGDKNYNLIVKKAKGRFVWLFSDDDKLKQNAIIKVLDVINNNPNLGHIFVNWGGWNHNFKILNVERTVKIHKDILFTHIKQYLKVVKLNSLFISSIIINRQMWLFFNINRFMDSDWHHYAKIQEIISYFSSYIIAYPFIMYRGSSGGRFDKNSERTLLQTLRLNNILNYYKKKLKVKKEYNNLIKVQLYNLPVEIVNLKLKKLKMNKFHIYEHIKSFKIFVFFWLICFPMMCIPYILYLPFRKIIRMVIPSE